MEKFITHLKTFIHQYHHKIIGYLCLALFFAYAYLIRHELQVADNTGNIKIVAVPEKNDKSADFKQSLRNITIDGQLITWESKEIVHNDWGLYAAQQVYPLFTADAKEKKAFLEINNKYEGGYSLSFEYASYQFGGFLRVYVDNRLLTEIDTYGPELQYQLINLRLPQHLGVSQKNLIWWGQLAFFALMLLIFFYKRLYKDLTYRNVIKTLAPVALALATIQAGFDLFPQKYINLFNSMYAFNKVALTLTVLTLLLSISSTVLKELIKTKWRWISQISYLALNAVTPFLTFFILENPYSQIDKMAAGSASVNLQLITIIWLSLALLFTSLRAASIFTVSASLILSIANKLMLDARAIPILAYHFGQIGTGLTIADTIEVIFNNNILQALILAWIFVIALLFMPGMKQLFATELNLLPVEKWTQKFTFLRRKLYRKACLAGIGLITVLFITPALLFNTAKKVEMDLSYWGIQDTYRERGFTLSFIRYYMAAQVVVPEGYTVEKTKAILDQYPKTETQSTKKPNIILIQNEALTDYSKLTSLQFDNDPLAYIHSIADESIQGNIYTSVIGGGTAQTEYEVLSGNGLALLPPNTFGFQQFVTSPKQSVVSSLKKQGYTSVGMHPYSKNNYSRNQVYRFYGFDQRYFSDSDPSISTLYTNEMLRGYTTDRALYQGTQKLIAETKEPLFNFIVTMQGHSGYNTPEDKNPRTVRITNAENNFSATDFLSSVKVSDQAFKEFTEMLQSSDEPTLVAMYGDHQPGLSNSYFDTYLDKNDKGSHYKTPLIIWANFPLPKRESPNISPNYIVPYLYDLLSETEYALPIPSYYQFMNQVQKEIPIMTAWGYYDKNGQYSEKAPTDSKLFKELQYVQHNRAFDKKAEELKSSYE